ncbi:hypothetical protein EIP99_11705 [Xanthomonas campestris pv. raphani]
MQLSLTAAAGASCGSSVAASMQPHGPAIGEGTAPKRSPQRGNQRAIALVTLACRCASQRHESQRIRRTACASSTMCTDTLDWSLPAHRRGTLRGMDAA